MTRDKLSTTFKIVASVAFQGVNLMLSMCLVLVIVQAWIWLVPLVAVGMSSLSQALLLLAVMPIVSKLLRRPWATFSNAWLEPEAARRWSESQTKDYLTSVTVYPSLLQRVLGCPVVVTFDEGTKKEIDA